MKKCKNKKYKVLPLYFNYFFIHIYIDDINPPKVATIISCIVSITPVSRLCCRLVLIILSTLNSNTSQVIAISATIPRQNSILSNFLFSFVINLKIMVARTNVNIPDKKWTKMSYQETVLYKLHTHPIKSAIKINK